jgi:hypothetical protein
LHFAFCILHFALIQYSTNASSGKQYNQRSPGSADATTGCSAARAWALACRFGEESQQSVTPHVWHVRRCIQRLWIFTHSSHSRRFGRFTSVTDPMCSQAAVMSAQYHLQHV